MLAEISGWQVMKQAREMVAAGRVLDSEWKPPVLRGTVQMGNGAARTGLVLKSKVDIENICPCRDSRERGIICAHAVALGLHIIEKSSRPADFPARKIPAEATETAPRAGGRRDGVRKSKALLRANAGVSGEKLELRVILPPNLPEAITRGQVMLYIEGRWARGQTPLNAVPFDRYFALGPEDERLLDILERFAEGDTPGMLRLTTEQLTEVFAAATGHPRFTIGKGQTVRIQSEPARVTVIADLQPNGEIVLRSVDNLGLVFGIQTPWLFKESEFRPAGFPSITSTPTRISRAEVPFFVSQTLPGVEAGADLQTNFSLDSFELVDGQPSFQLSLAGGIATLEARLRCLYGTCEAAESNGLFWIPDPAKPTRYISRDTSREQEAVARLVRAGFAGPDSQGLYHLKGQESVLNFFAREFPRVQHEWKTSLEERLQRSMLTNIERIEPRFQITHSGEEWFELQVSYGTRSGQQLGAADIQRLLRSGQSHTRLANGKLAVLDTGAVEELTEVLVDCAPEQQAGAYRMRQAHAGFLQSTIQRQQGWRIEASATWTARTARQTGRVDLAPPDLGPLQSVLRPYQKDGVAWLRFLHENSFGGILADDMGLGKTLQVLAHLAVLRRERPHATEGSAPPWLVVCPSSLVFNWLAEASKFTPELRALAIQGQDRAPLLARISEHDLIITSYALLRRDAEHYRSTQFETVVLDEAQHIKNRETQNAQAVKAIQSRHRLVLTGTPLENSVLDLWSIFDFLMPGYLGSAKDFKERYEVPITHEKRGAVQERLTRRLKPFMLRRLKREVARDLPEKIELISYCEMTEAQAGLYREMLEASRAEITHAVGANGVSQSRILVLTALLRLRQICCDPRLLRLEADSPDGETKCAAGSGKLELFNELIEQIIDGGHRVLVFSQFTSMLSLLKDQLERDGIEYCWLDGSTRDRGSVVQRFQSDERFPVFLISLKAGGVGLNLTAADTVIHFDPWWNPAVEAQATDRAHRIGQTQVVTSYKLITRGTVEEKILKLQQRKRAMFDKMLGDEQLFAESLNWEEIQGLVSG